MQIQIRKPDDFHIHLRQGLMLVAILIYSIKWIARAIIMPNTAPAILTGKDAARYRQEINDTAAKQGIKDFRALMTIQITPQTTPAMIYEADGYGVIAGKMYAKGMTTNSEDGVEDFMALASVYEAMARVGMKLLIHGELPGVFCLDREEAFLATLVKIAYGFPALQIVLEHVTTAAAVRTVTELPANVAATITVHHLYLTLDDVVGGKLQPHHFCKPLAKRDEDRAALIEAATSGNPKFFFGSDSAPHARDTKECSSGCAGIFAPPEVTFPLLASLFQKHGKLERLEPFVSEFGAHFYGLPLNDSYITLTEKSWVVPDEYAGVVPFMAGETLAWSIL